MNFDIGNKLSNLLNSLFNKTETQTSKVLEQTLMLILYLFGVVLWIRFLNYGNIPNNRLDWGDITFPRLQLIQQAVRQGQLPLYVAEENGLKGVTNLFLSIPDQILSPDVILLRFLTIENFILIHILLFYSLGFWGLILFKKHHNISIVAFLPLFLLFNFNGHIVSHLSVGHLTWASYFLYSFFFLFIFEIIDRHSLGWKWIGKVSILQLFIFLSGGYHQFVWGLLLLGVIFLFTNSNKIIIFYAILFSVLISSFRIFPAALLSNEFKIDFLAGFPTFESILGGLAYISLPSEAYYPMLQKNDIMVWEQNYYLSIIGLGFIIYFGIIFFKGKRNFALVVIPSLIMLILSTGNIYKVFFDSGIPLISGERISTRFLIMAILYLLFFAVIRFQDKLILSDWKMKVGFLIGILFIANDLSQHIAHWGVENIINIFPTELYFTSLSLGSGINYLYMNLLIIGTLITVLIFVYLIIRIYKTTK